MLPPGFNCCPEVTTMSKLMQKGVLSYFLGWGKAVNRLVPGKRRKFSRLCRYLNLNAALLEVFEADGTN